MSKRAQELLEAATRWHQGGVNALQVGLRGVTDDKETAQVLKTGARCLRRAADLMDEAAKLLDWAP